MKSELGSDIESQYLAGVIISGLLGFGASILSLSTARGKGRAADPPEWIEWTFIGLFIFLFLLGRLLIFRWPLLSPAEVASSPNRFVNWRLAKEIVFRNVCVVPLVPSLAFGLKYYLMAVLLLPWKEAAYVGVTFVSFTVPACLNHYLKIRLGHPNAALSPAKHESQPNSTKTHQRDRLIALVVAIVVYIVILVVIPKLIDVKNIKQGLLRDSVSIIPTVLCIVAFYGVIKYLEERRKDEASE